MKFTISKKQFLSALQDANLAISSTSPVPALTGIKIKVEDNSITLTASDADISIEKYLTNENCEGLDLNIEETGAIVIEAKYILDIVNKIDSDIVKMDIIDGSLTMITGITSEYQINGMKAVNYPTIDFSKPENKLELSAKTLSTIIDEVSFATATEENRPILTGVNFQIHDHKMECNASDSYRLAKKIIDVDVDINTNFTIPASAFKKVKSLFGDGDDMVSVYQNDKKVQFSNDNLVYQTRLLDGSFPDIDKLLKPLEFNRTLTISRSSLINTLDASMFIKNDNIIINRLQCSEEEVIFSNRNQEIGAFKKSLTQNGAKYEGEPLDISFSGTYILQAARALKGDTITIKFCGEMKPFVLLDPSDESIIQLALPLRTYK